MSRTLDQIFIDNPITTNQATDLMYFVRSPYSPGDDAGMTFADFAAQFGAPFTPAPLTKTNDTNVTLTLGGTPNAALLQATSLTLGWTGQLSPTRGGTGVNNGASTITLGGSLTTSGAFASTFTMTGITNVTFPTSGTLATTTQLPTPAALTKTDDTNVTLTLGGTPATALLQATSLTLGWTGTLSPTRGGTGVNNGTSTLTLGGNLTTSGSFASTFTMTGITNVTFPTSGTLATTSQIPTGAALTKTDDTNVTLSLGGSPSTALVNAASLTLGWTGTLSGTRGGTGVNNGTNTATFAGNLNFAAAFTTSGNFAVTQTYTGITNVTFPTSGTLATTTQLPTPAALTKTDDTNVTLTLGGTPATALLQATSLTLGWTGLLAVARGGTGISSFGTGVATALGQNVTGTGGIVLANTPTITTPKIGTILDTNGNTLALLTTTAAAVNYINFTNNATGLGPILTAQGTDTNVILNLNGQGTGGVNAKGTGTNDNATAGYIGETISSFITTNTSISTATATNLTSISLTAGDWDVRGQVTFITASTTVLKQINGWISSTSASFPANFSTVMCTDFGAGVSNVGVGTTSGVTLAPRRFSLSATTTIYISAYITFTTSTVNMQGYIEARRVR